MQNIYSHIAYLLTKYECVIIPGFGALVHSPAPAKSAMDEDIFSPPSVSLGFNPELKHNDGILADSIKRERKIPYNEANKIVSDFSVELVSLLKNKGEFTIPQVGHFVLSQDKKINFSPSTDLSANAGQFGFKNFYMPLLSEIVMPVEKEEPEKIKGKHVVMIPLSKKMLTAASIAAIALIFLLLSTPIDNKEIPTQYAGMFSSYMPIQEKVSVELPVNKDKGEVLVKDTAVSFDSKEDTVSSITTIPEKENNPEIKLIVKDEKVPPVISNSTNGYLIIIASFPNKSDAEKMLPYFKKQFNSASIIEKSDRSRIYIRSFQDKDEAEYFLNKFRLENPKHKDAWLLSNKVRG